MLVKFQAERVFLDEDSHCTVVTFDTSGQEYLNLQRAHPPVSSSGTGEVPPDEEVYLERLGQACAARGGVEVCQLGRTRLRLQVSADTARQLRGASAFEITFEIGAAEFARLRALFRNLLRGVSGYEVVEAEPGAAPDRGGMTAFPDA